METTNAPFKLVLFGKGAVGKTSLFAWALRKPFDVNVQKSIAVMFVTRDFAVNDRTVTAQIWDTAGQERFANITRNYFRDAAGGLAVFDLTDRETLDLIKEKVGLFKQTAREGAAVVLVGNKTDLVSAREVTEEQGRQVAEELGVLYVETSAKDLTGVEAAFTLCAEAAAKKFTMRPMSIVLDRTRPLASDRPKKTCCCSVVCVKDVLTPTATASL